MIVKCIIQDLLFSQCSISHHQSCVPQKAPEQECSIQDIVLVTNGFVVFVLTQTLLSAYLPEQLCFTRMIYSAAAAEG
jgi:hypothetical protein